MSTDPARTFRGIAAWTAIPALFVAVTACEVPEPEFTEMDAEAVHAAEEAFVEAIEAGDAEAIAGGFLEGGVMLPPLAPEVEGRDAIRAWWDEDAPGVESLEVTPRVTDGRTDLAYVWGTYSVTLVVDEDETADEDGKYVSVWQRDADGAWRLAAHTWNSSHPPEQE